MYFKIIHSYNLLMHLYQKNVCINKPINILLMHTYFITRKCLNSDHNVLVTIMIEMETKIFIQLLNQPQN